MPRRSDVDAQLQALYDQVPAIPDCDGSCWISCGPIEMADRERQRLRDAGYKITPSEQARLQADTYWCEALTGDRRCAVYELRPMICRTWGAVEGMKCPRGCVPEGGFLTDDQGWQLLAEADRVGGHDVPRQRDIASLPPAAREHMQRVMAAGRGGVGLRARHNLPPGFRPKLAEFPCPSCGFLLAVPDGPPRGGVCGNCGGRLKQGDMQR
jgi:Fe-S-cluster containining protein